MSEKENKSKNEALPAKVNAETLGEIFRKIANVNFDLRAADPKSPIYPILINGHKGVGKTDLIKQFAKRLAEERKEKVNTYFLYLSTQDQADLLGMPYTKDGRTLYARPEWFPEENSKECHIIVCDEYNRAPQYVQQTMLPFSVGGQLHTHFLPAKSLVVFLCNPSSEEYHVSHFNDAAFYDRMARFSYAPTLEEWVEYSKANGTHKTIIATAEKMKDKMITVRHVNDADNIHVEPSNRTFTKLGVLWSKLDNKWLEKYGDTLATAYIGREYSLALMKEHKKILEDVLSVEDILKNVDKHLSWLEENSRKGTYEAGKFDQINTSLINHMTENFSKSSKDKNEIKNLTTYLGYLGDDQCFKFFTDIVSKLGGMKLEQKQVAFFIRNLDKATNWAFSKRMSAAKMTETSKEPETATAK